MLKGPTVDPNNPNEHCLPYLEELITKCQRAVREIEHDLPPAPKQVYKAFMGRLLDINTSDKAIDEETVRERLDDALGRMDRSRSEKKRTRTGDDQQDIINANNADNSQIDFTLCQVKGCKNKKAQGMQTRFCSDCFNKYKANKQPIPLKDGTTRDPLSTYQTPSTKGKGKGKGGKGKGKGKGKGGRGKGNDKPSDKGNESKFFNRLLTMMSDGTISLKEPPTDEEKQKKKKQKLAEDITKKLKNYGMSGIAAKLQIEG